MPSKNLRSEKWLPVARLFFLVPLPFILGLLVFPHTELLVSQLPASTAGSTSEIAHSISYSAKNFGSVPIPSSVNSIFPFANFLDFPPMVIYRDPSVCFIDRGSTLVFGDGTSAKPDFFWEIEFNGKKSVSVPANGEACVPVRFNENFTYNWNANVDLTGMPLNNTQFMPSISTSHKVVRDYGVLQGVVLIPAFFLFVLYPLAGIIRKIREGMMAQ